MEGQKITERFESGLMAILTSYDDFSSAVYLEGRNIESWQIMVKCRIWSIFLLGVGVVKEQLICLYNQSSVNCFNEKSWWVTWKAKAEEEK